ncbi:uncharacterized protein Tco_0892115 [Tanacetum coccineum]|uniref:Transposase-associated domain-containing protein n=1 Tax=Tanacetum coccineum TaxID=301880 RepID=A0ABQ5C6C7_9ASTR
MSARGDRGWMYKRRNSEGRLCSYYQSKVNEFLNFAFSIEKVVERKTFGSDVVFRIKCPCSKCKIKVFKKRDEVKLDLWHNGFIRGYTTWYAHGERKCRRAETGECSEPIEEDNGVGCTQMILDIHNATFQSHRDTQEEQAPNSFAKQYYEMLEADDEPLYEGCQKFSTLEAATRLLNWKAECNVPEATYNRALSLFKDMLPGGNKLVRNFYDTKKILSKLDLPREKIHACKNHCMLFYGKVDSVLTKCKVCGHSRYKKGGRNNVPNLVLTYFPIAPRLQRMYMSKKMSKEMTWHYDHKTDSNKMVHPSDGKAWKHFDSTHSTFSKEIRNVRLGLCTDGFNPNNSNSNPLVLWPFVLTIYNLPHLSFGDELQKTHRVEKLYGLMVVEQLMIALSVKNNFNMKATLLWTVSDFPAYAMLSGWSTHGKLACPYCMGNVDSFQLHNGGKPCWFDCHRRFLPARHPYRHDRKGFLAQKSVFAGPPPHLTGTEIWQQIRHLPTVYEGEPYKPKNKKIDGFGQTHNWVKRNIFWELPYWHTLLIRHNLDLMHIEKNFFENLFQTIMGSLKTKDNVKARKDVDVHCDRPELHMFKVQNRDMKPKASLLPIALRGMIPNVVWDAITEICTFFSAICSRVLRIEDLEKLQKSIVETICKLEKIFPPGFFDSMEHLVVHLVWEALLGSPVQYRWMYLYERKLGSLKRTVRNKSRVEGSIVESYLLNELSMHFSLYFDPRIETRLNREPQNFAPDIHCSSPTDTRLNIFKVPSRRLFDTGTKRNLTNAEKHKAHTYILLNCEDVHPFLRLFDNYIMQEDPYIDEETLDRARDEKFAQWFKEHIQSNGGNEHLKVLARGPMRYVESHKVLEVNYRDSNGRCVVVLFKCDWFEPIQGVRVNRKHNLVDIKYKSKGCQNDPFILASQAEQVYYAPYPSMTKDLKDWWAVVKATPRSIYEVTQSSNEVVDDNVDVEEFFQENEMPTCSNTTDANENNEKEEVGDLEVGDAYMEVGENEEEFIDRYDESDDENELALSDHSSDEDEVNLSDHSSDEDEVNLSDHSLNDYLLIIINWTCYAGIMAARDNNSKGRGRGRGRGRSVNGGIIGTSSASDIGIGGRSGGRGRGISGNIGIGGSSSNISGFGNQEDANYKNGSRSGGRGRGISGNIGIGGSSNVSEFVDQDVDYDDGRSEGRGISENIGGRGSSNVSRFGNQEDANYDNCSRSGGRGRGISGNIGIGGGSSSNVSGFDNQEDANYENGSRSGGRGRGISGNIGIGGSSNISEFVDQDVDYDDGRSEGRDYDNGSRSEGRGRGKSGNIGGRSSSTSGCSNSDADYDNGSISRGRGISGNINIGGGSNVSGFHNQDADYNNGSSNYDNGSINRGRGRSGNIDGRGSSSTSRCGNPDADFDTNDNETETSQRVRSSNLVQSIPNHPSQRPMITLYYGGFAESYVTRDIISIFKVLFYGPWATWRKVDQESRDYTFEEFQDLYQWHPSKNAAVYKAWERVMSSRYSDILGQCRRDAAHRATIDNITVGNDLSVLKPYTPSWIDQAHWDNMIDRLRIQYHSSTQVPNGKRKKWPVSLLEAYHRTNTSTNVSSEALGSRMDEASEGRMREYVTTSSKRVADAVEAAIVEKHGPDASEHPPNDFDLWGEATGGRKKGKLVGLGTRGDQRVMVTRTTATSSSSSTSNEQVQTFEEMIRRLQEENTQIRSQNQREMQIEIQRQVEHQVLEHMRQRKLEANAREQAREREWKQRMNDINSVLRKFTDSRPPP